MTADEIFQFYLERLDRAYATLRQIHADPIYMNDSTTFYKDALKEFADAQADLFTFKRLWYVAKPKHE